MIANPKFKGKWKAPMIDNPNFKGKWMPKKIPNPEYFFDDTPLKSSPIVSTYCIEKKIENRELRMIDNLSGFVMLGLYWL
jgi:hypothetical protein